MKRKAIIPLLLGLGIGLAAVKVAVDTIRKAQAANSTPATVKVVWATQDIDAYEAITAEMVDMIETGDSRFAPTEDRFESVDDVIGRVPSKAIAQRTPVLKSMLTPLGTPPGLVGKIPAGFRAVSVRIDEASSVAYQISAGDWVDVIVVMDVPSMAGRGGKDTIAEVILQHVQVGAIGQATAPSADGGPGKVKPAKSATLLVPEEEVPKLHLAATRGKITLAMRGDDDETQAMYQSASMNDVIPGMAPPQPKHVVPAEPTGPSWGQALVSFLASRSQQQQSWPVEPVPEDEPHAVVVVHGAASGAAAASIERITFEDTESSNVLEVTPGLPARATSRMTSGTFSAGRTRGYGTERTPQRTREVKKEDTEPNDGQ
jgi:pilus assembly protein CpaB